MRRPCLLSPYLCASFPNKMSRPRCQPTASFCHILVPPPLSPSLTPVILATPHPLGIFCGPSVSAKKAPNQHTGTHRRGKPRSSSTTHTKGERCTLLGRGRERCTYADPHTHAHTHRRKGNEERNEKTKTTRRRAKDHTRTPHIQRHARAQCTHTHW